jgi:hypothetical protein
MAYRLKFAGPAVQEIGEAFDWYEEQSEGLGLIGVRFEFFTDDTIQLSG